MGGNGGERQTGLHYQSTALTWSKDTCGPLTVEHTNKHKNILFNLPRTIKVQAGLEDRTYKGLYSTDTGPNTVYGIQKYINKVPLRPLRFSSGAVTYEVAKELANILRLLVGHYPITSITLNTL